MPASTEQRMGSGAAWMVLFKLGERSLGIVSILILVRLLSPHDFGFVAMALSFIAMAELLTRAGFDVALIQNQAATDHHYHTAWTCNVLIGLFIFLLMLVAAAPITAFYAEPTLFWVVCWLALGPLISGCENIGVVAFRKELRFRSEFAYQMSVKLAGFVVTVPLAFWLRSYWALVAGILATKLMGTVISYFAHPFRPRFSIAGAGTLFSFSKWLLLVNGLAFLKERLTDFVIGRSQGAAILGVYNVAWDLAYLPTSELGAPINRALLPGFSQIAQNPAQLHSAYANAMGILVLFALPAATGIFAVSEYLVPVALGPKWLAAVPLMQILALSGAILLFHSSMCAALIGAGHPAAVVKGNAVFVVLLMVLLIPLAEQFGASGAAVAVVGASILSTPAYLKAIRVHIGIAPAVFARAITRPLTASVAMLAVLRAVMPAYSPSMTTSKAAWLLLGAVVLGAFLYALAMALLWLAARRPQSVERLVFERVRGMLVARTAWRRKTPDA
ncbi:MAG: lipopolysaccharide biosynthesis protein [Betaproteobacteria bacterium]|nr:MAG: lipopolysaccharide biosynthesis protein [Betaproteobacteria bacterium]